MKKISLLLIFYLVILALVLGNAFLNDQQSDYSATENRTLTTRSYLEAGNFKETLEDLLADQFPFKEKINSLNSKLSSLVAETTNELSEDMDAPFLIGAGDVYRVSGTDYYMEDLLHLNDEYEALLENRIWNFQKIYEKYGNDYKLYIYKPLSLEESRFFDDAYGHSDGEECWERFYNGVGCYYRIKRQEMNSLEDYYEKHYKTDHHWNEVGAYEGYVDIITMMHEDNEAVAEPYEIEETIHYEEPFYGSLSRRNNKTLGYDDFIVYKLDTEKDFTYYINGEEVDALAKGEDIFDDPYGYVYEGYYGYNEKEIRIINNNADNDLTLLVFGDSFSNCINEDLALHYKTTYIIDTRFIYEDGDSNNTTFSLDDFLEEHEVDSILWLQFYTSLYFDNSCYLPLK